MRLNKRICLGTIITMLLPITAFANSAPMIVKEDPTFSIAPMGSTPISVISEYLEFDMRKEQGNTARVTASYEMENTSRDTIEQMMLFPFITAHRKGFIDSVKITVDNTPIVFKTFRLQDIPYGNYDTLLNDRFNGELPAVMTIDNIIKILNQDEYIPKNYDLNQRIKVYTLHLLPKEEAYQEEISFRVDPQKHKLLTYNNNGFTYNRDGSGSLTMWVAPKMVQADGQKIHMVVLGEDVENEASFESLTGQEIAVEEKPFGEFLKEDIIKNRLIKDDVANEDELYPYAIRQLDEMLYKDQPFIFLDEDVISQFFHNTYIGALLYQVTFPPEGTMDVTVEYEMEATKDRRQTRDFTDMFVYLLRPAAGWKGFGHLTINVIPNNSKPFVIESSLPLTKEKATGVYSGEFEGLPEKDFYFITYKTDQPDPPLARFMGNALYYLVFSSPVILGTILIGGIITVAVAINKKRNY